MELMQANEQWASRPSDQRFVTLTDLNDHCINSRDNSRSAVVSSRRVEARPIEGSTRGLSVVLNDDAPLALTHWSFGQLSSLAKAPAGYLRQLPGPMAADCLNYGLNYSRSSDIQDIGVYMYRNGGPAELRAATGPAYGRVHNATITQALVDRFGDGITGQFRVPGEFGKAVAITKANTTLYASDRDMWVFLADEEHRIEMPNRRDGKSGSLARGFFIWNSEVGSASLGIATFLFDYACSNRIVWGATEYKRMAIRHTASAPDRFIEEMAPALEDYAHSSTKGITEAIANAQAKKIDKVDEFLMKRFSRPQVAAINAAHMSDEQRPIETIWDAATGITAYARGISHQDERVKLEREAGKIIDLVAE
jgi:Domain of unknown function (DUF932)